MKNALTLALAATSALALSSTALAQAPLPAGANQNGYVSSATVPSVCVFNRDGAVGTSAVGKAMITRFQQIGASVNSELTGAYNSVQSEAAAIQASRTSLPQDQLDQRALAARQHQEAFVRLREQRGAELEATQKKQVEAILMQIDPLLKQTYTERNCGLLIDATVTYGGYNSAMDITPTVVAKLNAKVTTVNFDREHLDQNAGQGVAAAAPQQPTSVAPAPRKKK